MTLQTVHVIYGNGWFLEFPTMFGAKAAQALVNESRQEGEDEAHYKEALPAKYALFVEFYPKDAGLRDGHPEIRRHKWAYNQWCPGPPSGYNEGTGEIEGMMLVERKYSLSGGHHWYNPIPEEMPNRLHIGHTGPRHSTGPAAPTPQAQRQNVRRPFVNPVTGKATIYCDNAFFQ